MSVEPVSLDRRGLRFTTLFLCVMVAANFVAGSIFADLPRGVLDAWGIAHHRLLNGEVWRLITSTFLSHDSGMFLRQFVFAALVIGYYEWHWGVWRTASMFFAIDIIGTIVLLVALIGPLAGLPHPMLEGIALRHDVGMSAGGFGLVGAILAMQQQRWLWFGGAFVLLAAKLALWPDIIADLAHILTLVMGFALQRAIFGIGRGGP